MFRKHLWPKSFTKKHPLAKRQEFILVSVEIKMLSDSVKELTTAAP